MFLSRRVVPATPPSLVKFSCSAAELMIGAGSSEPRSDQVPELRNAARGPVATDATADAVSWQAGATTGVPHKRGDALSTSRPTIDPGSTSGCSRWVGRPISSSIRVAHDLVRASMNCVVVATVYSDDSDPVSQ